MDVPSKLMSTPTFLQAAFAIALVFWNSGRPAAAAMSGAVATRPAAAPNAASAVAASLAGVPAVAFARPVAISE